MQTPSHISSISSVAQEVCKWATCEHDLHNQIDVTTRQFALKLAPSFCSAYFMIDSQNVPKKIGMEVRKCLELSERRTRVECSRVIQVVDMYTKFDSNNNITCKHYMQTNMSVYLRTSSPSQCNQGSELLYSHPPNGDSLPKQANALSMQQPNLEDLFTPV